MPLLQSHRQASLVPWFDSEPAAALRVLERQLLLPRLATLPSQPWLWIAPTASWLEDAQLGGRGLRLYREGAGYAGDTRCALPLPLANESVNAIVLQHVTAADADYLLDECSRVLMPGGQLWLSSLNPFSPYRTRWRQHGLVVRTPQRLRLLLARHGLECDDTRYLGPLWQGAGSRRRAGWAPLRAACLFHAEKRTLALPGPTPLPVRWHGTVAT
ncbi:class I SAM-dependent methyltransferase [uncultured Stenotrophomonas sp.]|uniref:class I SAM-dependent methyltransferase n=1 Tax=uncultured Stenotrophomonas sp. TaxID=165438 RepID=UPI0025EC6326|nr:class I SAM-dependent methyltransferase [uncultured Stenotrophomonas sp.]